MPKKSPTPKSSLEELPVRITEKPTSQPQNVTLNVTDPNVVWLPTIPPRPAPDLLTTKEVILLLRLEKGAERTIKHYVATGMLKAVRFGRNNRFRRPDVMKFINEKGE